MASVQGSLPSISAIRSCHQCSSQFFSTPATGTPLVSLARSPGSHRKLYVFRSIGRKSFFRAMVQQAVQGTPEAYAKEMERLSAKESLLLAFKDSGGFEGLVTGKTTDIQRVDVNERITGLERLNLTPRPSTSPFLEGRWNFEWFGSGSPGLISAARFVFELSVEGPLCMKEEYVEGILESPTVIEETVPEQLRGAFGQAVNTMQQLPVPIRDVVATGLTIPLSGSFQRLFMISYLDDEILIIRDTAGVPEVLTRLVAPPSPLAESVTEYARVRNLYMFEN